MNKIELLMPAGNLEALKYACNNGADAIYLGMNSFSARAFANNFSREDLIEGINYAHLLNVKVYVTLNTLIDESQFNKAIELIDFLYYQNVDALIIQDLGLLEYISKVYPDFELHASTQMHIHNLNGAKFITNAGIKRVVIARETPLKVIEDICKAGIEVEVFTYGALCVSYSGQCLISSFYSKRSANKGVCAQYCRMLYRLKNLSTNKYLTDYEYSLSMKDLRTITMVKDFTKAGVRSLKIEGRMKKPEYVALITKLYRKAIDDYYDNKEFSLDANINNQLNKLFNREYTKGFVGDASNNELVNTYRPNHLGIYLGEVIGYRDGLIDIKLKHQLNQFDGIRFINDKDDHGMIVNMLYHNKILTNKVNENEVASVRVDKYTPVGSKVFLTSDNNLLNELATDAKIIKRRVAITAILKAEKGKTLSITIKNDNYKVDVKSDYIVEQAKYKLDLDKVRNSLNQIQDTVYKFQDIIFIIDDDAFIPMSIVKKIRREALEKLNDSRLSFKRFGKKNYTHNIKEIIPTAYHLNEINDLDFFDESLTNISEFQLDQTERIPALIKECDNNLNSRFIKEIGDLYRLNDLGISLPSLNITNSYAAAFLYQHQVNTVYLSLELDEQHIIKIIDNFIDRYHIEPNFGYQNKGPVIVMHLKYHPPLMNKDDQFALVDLKNRIFKLHFDANGYLNIYSDFQLSLNYQIKHLSNTLKINI